MPDLRLPAETVARIDAMPERGHPLFISRNKMGAILIDEAIEVRLTESRKKLRNGPKLKPR